MQRSCVIYNILVWLLKLVLDCKVMVEYRLSRANTSSLLVEFRSLPFDLIFFFTCFLWCASMHAQKRLLNISCRLPKSLHSHTHKPKKIFLAAFASASRYPDSGFSPTQWHILLFQVLTFDGSGVSGHANHIAIYNAVRYRKDFKDFCHQENLFILFLQFLNFKMPFWGDTLWLKHRKQFTLLSLNTIQENAEHLDPHQHPSFQMFPHKYTHTHHVFQNWSVT